jgi:hypothetical protein
MDILCELVIRLLCKVVLVRVCYWVCHGSFGLSKFLGCAAQCFFSDNNMSFFLHKEIGNFLGNYVFLV